MTAKNDPPINVSAAMRPLLGVTAFFIILIASCVSAPGAYDSPAPSEKSRFDYALGLYMRGAYEPAVKEFKDLIKDHPKGEYADDASYWLGKYYVMNGSYEEGLERFKAVLADFPAGGAAPLAQFEVARYWYEPANPKHDYQKAMVEFLRIPFFYPDSSLVDKAAYYAAMCQVRLRDYAKAEAELKALTEKYPESELAAPALYQLGLCYVIEGRIDAALAAFQSVRDKYPAGLYRQRALDAIELVARGRDKAPLTVSFVYGSKGGGPGMFKGPTGAAADMEGALYVTDTGNGRVQRLKVRETGLEPDTPSFIAPASDKGQNTVKPAGIFVGGPRSLVYVTDQAMDRLQVFEPTGRLVASFGKHGSGLGDLDNPAGVTVDEGGNVYVADRGNRRVEVFDGAGRFLRAVGNSGSTSGNLLKSPSGVALDIEGFLLVTDDSAGRVYKYDEDGRLTAVYGEDQRDPFRLDEPTSVAVDRVGNVYVANRGSRSVLVLDKDLKPLMAFPASGVKTLDSPSGIVVLGAGQVFITDQGLNKVVVFK